MKIETNAISYILRSAVKRHGVLLGSNNFDMYADGAVRNTDRPGWHFVLRAPSWSRRVELDERRLLLAANAEATFALVDDALAIGASALRGQIFRDLLMNDAQRPVDYVGDGSADEIKQRVEALGVALIAQAERLR